MGLLELLRTVARRATEPMGVDEGHPMWSADPGAPDQPDRDEDDEGALFGLLGPRWRVRWGARWGAHGLDLGRPHATHDTWSTGGGATDSDRHDSGGGSSSDCGS